jgi:hypothetical protein
MHPRNKYFSNAPDFEALAQVTSSLPFITCAGS